MLNEMLVKETLEEYIKTKGDEEHLFGIEINGKEIEGDVKELIKMVDSGKYEIQEYEVKDLGTEWDDMEGKTVLKDGKMVKFDELSNEEQRDQLKRLKKDIMKSSLKYPIILTKTEEGFHVLDGNHRLSKAKILGKNKIKGYFIPQKDILKKFKDEGKRISENIGDVLKPKSFSQLYYEFMDSSRAEKVDSLMNIIPTIADGYTDFLELYLSKYPFEIWKEMGDNFYEDDRDSGTGRFISLNVEERKELKRDPKEYFLGNWPAEDTVEFFLTTIAEDGLSQIFTDLLKGAWINAKPR